MVFLLRWLPVSRTLAALFSEATYGGPRTDLPAHANDFSKRASFLGELSRGSGRRHQGARSYSPRSLSPDAPETVDVDTVGAPDPPGSRFRTPRLCHPGSRSEVSPGRPVVHTRGGTGDRWGSRGDRWTAASKPQGQPRRPQGPSRTPLDGAEETPGAAKESAGRRRADPWDNQEDRSASDDAAARPRGPLGIPGHRCAPPATAAGPRRPLGSISLRFF